ncbi:MAG: hypothetical protein AAGC45_09615 [Bacteroidota bacterium]
MKKIELAIAIVSFCCFAINAQDSNLGPDFDFVPDDLVLLPMEALFQNPPPATMEQVYYNDGTKTTLGEVMPLIMQRKATPYMYVDADRNYKILVVKKVEEVESEPIQINYKNIPKNLKGLGYSFGNPESDTVIIHTQIGPMMRLLTEDFKGIFTNIGGIDVEKYYVINAHQEQTLHPEKYAEKEITFEEAKALDKRTSQILHELVTYFKAQNKTVYLAGLSFGAFAGIDFIAEYGNTADGYLFMVGRLDMTPEVWQSFSQGVEATFEEDATTVIVKSKAEDFKSININKIAAGFGHNRYTELVKEEDLSNLIYYYGKKDQSVGKLTDAEVQFLESKGAKVIGFDGGHNQTLDHLKEGLTLLLKN